MERFRFISKNKIDSLPKASGIYAFKNAGDLIYIGKAANIQSRVKNHFQQPSYRDNLFANKIDKIGFLKTGSEIEALILEANLIKKYQPKFNVMWRDDKNYFYIAIKNNDKKIPYLYITHQPRGRVFIGPFTEGVALKKTLRFLRRVFPYYTNKKHPKNKCTYCHLDLCPGPNPDLAEYKKNIKKLKLILQGKRKTALGSLKKEMVAASKIQDFEKAGKIRDQIYNLQQITAHTHVINPNFQIPNPKIQTISNFKFQISGKAECYDVSNIQGKHATGSMVVFVNGKPDKNQYRKFKIRLPQKPNDIAMLKEVISRRLIHSEWNYPDIMLIDGGKAQLNAAVACKSKISKIKIISLAKGRQDPLRPQSEARLFVEGQDKPTPLKQLPQEVYNLIKHLDDEAHRFAISYHKTLRKKDLLG